MKHSLVSAVSILAFAATTSAFADETALSYACRELDKSNGPVFGLRVDLKSNRVTFIRSENISTKFVARIHMHDVSGQDELGNSTHTKAFYYAEWIFQGVNDWFRVPFWDP